jgi:hypothetical protein
VSGNRLHRQRFGAPPSAAPTAYGTPYASTHGMRPNRIAAEMALRLPGASPDRLIVQVAALKLLP